jgi:hypothetical protein
VESGSSHTFLNSIIASKLQLCTSAILPISVQVANGAILSCTSEVPNFKWWCQGHTFQVNAKVLAMGAYNLVLGMEWLEKFRPMTCDWLEKWIEFYYNNTLVRLQGIVPSEPSELQEIFVEQVVKWHAGNDIWVVVLVESSSKSSTLVDQYMLSGIPASIKDLILEFDQIFQQPTALPPSR